MTNPLYAPRARGLALAALVLVGSVAFSQSRPARAGDPDWSTILTPVDRSTWPAPAAKVVWREDMAAALKEAKASGKPLFVTFRCLPCKQCMSMDQAVLEGGAKLDPLLKRFITVRITSMSEVDQRLFRFDEFQDLDCSWWGTALSPEGRIYGVYGGIDERSDRSRISPEGLAAALTRILDHHVRPSRRELALDGPAPKLEGAAVTPPKLPGYQRWRRESHDEVRAQTCLHCHQVNDILRQPAITKGTFDKSRDFDVWPYPENIGLSLDRDDGLAVKGVKPGSPAARAGIKAGDRLVAGDGRLLHSSTDLRGVLHRGPEATGEVVLVWRRDGAIKTGAVRVKEGWRATNKSWRKSVAEARIGAKTGLPWPLRVSKGERRKRGAPAQGLCVKPWWGKKPKKHPAWQLGLRPGELIIAIDGERPDLHGRALHAWFRLRYDPGATVRYTVLDRKGQRRELSVTLER